VHKEHFKQLTLRQLVNTWQGLHIKVDCWLFKRFKIVRITTTFK
jgi:hypothetical protein